VDLEDIRKAYEINAAKIRWDFQGLPLTELCEKVLLGAGMKAAARGNWIEEDSIIHSLLTSESPVVTLLSKHGVQVDDLVAACRDYPRPPHPVDVNQPIFWELAVTGPTVARFATARGNSVIDTLSLLCGHLIEAIKDPPDTAHPASKLLRQFEYDPESMLKEYEAFSHLDPHLEDAQFCLTLAGKQIEFRNILFVDGFRTHVEKATGSPDLIIVKANVLHDRGLIEKALVDEFEQLINRTNISEYDIQKFFEAHPEFLMGNQYKALHAQLTLFRSDAPDLRPDFFAERIDNNFCDIIDLKKPNARLAKHPRNRSGFVAGVYDAIHQLREYRDYFEDVDRRKEFHEKYGLQAYRPHVSVIIGRSSDYLDFVQRNQIEDTLARFFKVVTYDDILAEARRRQIILAL
jgi:hypothetical protein